MYFFVPEINSQIITGIEAAHFFSLRVKAGQELKAVDLKGILAEIKIIRYEKKDHSITFEIKNQETFENQSQNVLYQAITDKYYMEKLFEVIPFMKLKKIVLFHSEFSIKLNPNLERLTNILTRSLEQSESLFIPEIQVKTWKEIQKEILETKPTVLDCYLEENSPLPEGWQTKSDGVFNPPATPSLSPFERGTSNLETTLSPNSKLLTTNSALVGPEGGWSENERNFYKENGFNFYSLGHIIYPAWLAALGYFASLPH